MTPAQRRRGCKRAEPIGTLDEQNAFYADLARQQGKRIKAERDFKIQAWINGKAKEENADA